MRANLPLLNAGALAASPRRHTWPLLKIITTINWWFDLPLKGAITGIAPIRGTELYYRITRTATRKRVQPLLQHLFLIQMLTLDYLLSFGKPHAKAIFLPPVKPGVSFHA